MSYALFDQGYTAEQVKGMSRPTHDELMEEKVRKWAESEHVLNLLRNIKSSQEFWTKMEAEAWLKATKRR